MTKILSNKPDFIILGAMKCATSTLHVQLGAQRGVHVSEPKEPNFFSDDSNFAKGIEWYQTLFDDSDDVINGESSTHYTKFPTYPETIDRMKSSGIGASTKFIYIVRNPIDRLVSHYLHEVSEGNISADIDAALDAHPELISYSKYAYQIEHYLRSFDHPSIMLVFFERLKADPQGELETIAKFLGLDADVSWNYQSKAQNVTSDRIKKFPLYSLLIESSLATVLRRTLVPKQLRTKVRDSLKVKTARPTLSLASIEKLKDIFSEDLIDLGRSAGISISLDTYHEVATTTRATLLRAI